MVQPSLESNVKTNSGKKILNILDKCFPKNSPLHEIFNRHTPELTHYYMPNTKSIIASHNKTILSNCTATSAADHVKECNCREKDQCPLEGQYLTNNIVYQATVTTGITTETYVRLATNFKGRYRNHTTLFSTGKKRNEIELFKHIWTLKNAKKPVNSKWRILRKCKLYNGISMKCNFCLSEKFFIIYCKKNYVALTSATN